MLLYRLYQILKLEYTVCSILTVLAFQYYKSLYFAIWYSLSIIASKSNNTQFYLYINSLSHPGLGVTLCFQFVSAAVSAAAATTFASHTKTVWT